MKKSILILASASLVFFSCRKEEKNNIKDTKNFVSQMQENMSRAESGSVTFSAEGRIDSSVAATYSAKPYSLPSNKYVFVQNDFYSVYENNSYSNVIRTSKYTFKDEDKNTQAYTVKTYSINMYETTGFEEKNEKNGNMIQIEFSVYEGTLTATMKERGYELATPQDIEVSITNYYKVPGTIDVIKIRDYVSTVAAVYEYDKDFNYVVKTKKVENVSVSGLTIDATGKIAFAFSGKDSKTGFNINGTVSTTIKNNVYLDRNND